MAEQSIRFAVGEPRGPRSSVWKLWTNGRSSDVYLASRDLGSLSKVSFHESGIWRDALTTTPAARGTDVKVVRLDAGTDPRMAQRWRRSDNAGPGWTMAFDVVVPEPDVFGPSPGYEVMRPVVYRAAPPTGASAILVLLWASPTAPLRDHPPEVDEGSWPLGFLDLPNGDRAWIVTFDRAFGDEAAAFAELKQTALDSVGDVDLTNRRSVVHGMREDRGFVVDLALEVAPGAYLR